MQHIRKYRSVYLEIVLAIFVVGFILGIIYFLFQSKDIQNNVISTIHDYTFIRYNAILKDLIIASIILILSFFVIGIPLSLFYLLYEGISLGFLFISFYFAFSFKGIIYMLIYFLINKLITLILFIFLIRKVINIGRLMIGLFLYRKETSIKDKIILNFKKGLYILSFILIVNIILYVISPIIFNNFAFLIK